MGTGSGASPSAPPYHEVSNYSMMPSMYGGPAPLNMQYGGPAPPNMAYGGPMQPYPPHVGMAYATHPQAPYAGIMPQEQPVVVMSQATATAVMQNQSLYDALHIRYKRMDNAILGLGITQMILWFPLGFLYFIGMLPPRGRQHMGIAVLFFILSMVGFITVLAIDYRYCYYDYNSNWYCYYYPGLKFVGFVFLPYIALSAASIGVGTQHRRLELALRITDPQRFSQMYPERTDSSLLAI